MAELLDTTLRDGSNANGHSYTEEDISLLVGGLAASGISWIEAGDGVSIGLPGTHARQSTVSNEKTLSLARKAASGAKIGAIAVPVLTSTAAIEPFYDYLDYIRLAAAQSEFDGCRRFVREAKARGKKVFIQLVKSHLYRLESIVEQVRPLAEEGIDALYVVDTAGCMMPEAVTRLVVELSGAYCFPIGFHGHNNCSLAMANSLAALRAGAAMIDGTLGGIGRGAGNLQLETFVALMQQGGEFRQIDFERLFRLSSYVRHRFPNAARGIDPIEAYYALHGWDSVSREEVLKTAQEGNLDEFQLIRTAAGRAKGFLITGEEIEQAAGILAGAEGLFERNDLPGATAGQAPPMDHASAHASASATSPG
ncbi:MAG: hypothetical protein ACRD27_06140 [Terracidiphilus sp.]